MHQRTALKTGEHCRIDFFAQHVVAAEDHAATWPAQGLVRRGGDDMGMIQRRGVNPARDQPGEMRHVHHEVCANRIRNLAEAGKIYEPRIGRTACDDQLGLAFLRNRRDLVHVDAVVLFAHRIGHGLEPFSGLVDR